jgi:hypothetical protein
VARDAERTAAQRRLAKQIKAGTYKPSGLGAKARRIAVERKPQIVDQIQALKQAAFGNRIKWNAARSRKYVQVDPGTGEDRTIKELAHILDAITRWTDADMPDDWEGLVDFSDGEYESAFYYH